MCSVFIVEDDADLVETYTDLLQAHQYSVTSTAKAVDAITLIMQSKPKIILLDLNLAGYSGTLVINVVRRHPGLKDTKIVVITGHPELLRRYDAMRVDFILRKPISNTELLEVIEKCVTPPLQS
jgi:CheY-like chemotaxis protein